jgi:dTMP kinase
VRSELLGEKNLLQDKTPVLKHFIVLEGLDGAGTTTQLKLLDKRLREVNMPHDCTFEPTNGKVGRLIRDVLRGKLEVHPQTLALLFAADRTEHVEKGNDGIMAHLKRGELVITDRYVFSSLAYQSIGCGFEFVFSINRGFPLPEVLFFIDTPPEVCQQRRTSRDREDLFDSVSFQKEVLQGYQKAFDTFQNTTMKVYRVNGTMHSKKICEKIWGILNELSIIRS